MNRFFSIQVGPKRPHLHKKCYCSLFFFFSHYSPCFFSISGYLCLPPFSINPIFLIYFFFSHISTIHPYLTYLLSRLLSLSVPEEGGERNLLRCDLHCLGHFLINAPDKAVAHHLMQTQQATPN